jgi:sec-independent protein translocase protein TatA
MSPGPWQIAIIILVILVVFGASRFAEIGKGLGEGIRNFKRGISDDEPERISRPDKTTKKLEGKKKGRGDDDEDDDGKDDDA